MTPIDPYRTAPDLQERLGRATGFLFIVLAFGGMFSFSVLQTLIVPGDAAATALNILDSRALFGGSLVSWVMVVAADVAAAITLYLLLEPVGRALSLVAAAFRLIYAAMLGALLLNLYDAFLLLTSAKRGAALDALHRQTAALSSLEAFSDGFLLALVFFGIHLVVLGVPLYRSRFVPWIFGVLLVAAGAGYIADSLATFFVDGHGGLAKALLVTPAIVGELGLTAWLLIKGVKVRRDEAREPSFPPHPAVAALVGAAGGAR